MINKNVKLIDKRKAKNKYEKKICNLQLAILILKRYIYYHYFELDFLFLFEYQYKIGHFG